MITIVMMIVKWIEWVIIVWWWCVVGWKFGRANRRIGSVVFQRTIVVVVSTIFINVIIVTFSLFIIKERIRCTNGSELMSCTVYL